MKIHILWLVLFVVVQGKSYAQEEVSDNFLKMQASIHYGVIAPHRPIITHLVYQHVVGLEVSLEKKAPQHISDIYGKGCHLGHTAYLFDLRNDLLGYQFGYYPYFKLRLNQFFQFRIGIGASYSTKTFDRYNNYKNLLVSSHINGVLHAKVEGELGLAKQSDLYFNYGLTFTHSSNGAFKMPNYGINLISFSGGLTFNGGESKRKDMSSQIKPLDSLDNKFRAELGVGMKETFPSGGKKFMTWSLSLTKEKMLGRWIAFTYGIDFFNNRALVNEQRKEGLGVDAPDTKQLAAVIGTDFWVGRLVGSIQYGVYFYQPYVFEGWMYSKLALRYKIYKDLSGGIRLKAHGGKADFVDLFLQYKW